MKLRPYDFDSDERSIWVEISHRGVLLTKTLCHLGCTKVVALKKDSSLNILE